jgi:hypothetical protein
MEDTLINLSSIPSLFVFDIDYTLWPLWYVFKKRKIYLYKLLILIFFRIDTHVSGPIFKADPSKPYCATDKYVLNLTPFIKLFSY